MAKEKIVRCMVSKAKAGERQRSVRYIPLAIFDLWKIMMKEKHDFTIEEACVSLWFDIDGDPNVIYPDSNYDKVVRLSLSVYSVEDGMFKNITRYFPSDSYDDIKPRFLSHYIEHLTGSRFPPSIEEKRGVWLKRVDG